MTTTISITYDVSRNALYVTGNPQPFPAGSLEARRSGDLLAVANPHQTSGSDLICQWLPFDAWAIDGAIYTDPDATFTALSRACSHATALAPVVTATASQSADNLPAGSPVALSRNSGQMIAARADTYVQAFVVGLADGDLSGGYPATAVRTYAERNDWTPVAGTPTLMLGQPYFLGLTGGVTPFPDRTPGNCLVRLGLPVSPTRLAFVAADPIQL